MPKHDSFQSDLRSSSRLLFAKVVLMASIMPALSGVGAVQIDSPSETNNAEFQENLEDGISRKRSRLRIRSKSYCIAARRSKNRNEVLTRFFSLDLRTVKTGHRLSNGLLAPLTC